MLAYKKMYLNALRYGVKSVSFSAKVFGKLAISSAINVYAAFNTLKIVHTSKFTSINII
jgi:hypothetical protein